MALNFSGEYRIECVADEHAAAVGLVDKPCWKITGPDGLCGVVWSWSRDPGRILYDFLREALDLNYGEHTPVVFKITATAS